MTGDDILRAVRGLRQKLDDRFPGIMPEEMGPEYKRKPGSIIHLSMHVAHLKYECDRIGHFLSEGTPSRHEKAMRWLSDIGGVLRGPGPLGFLSVDDLKHLFRPVVETDDTQAELDFGRPHGEAASSSTKDTTVAAHLAGTV